MSYLAILNASVGGSQRCSSHACFFHPSQSHASATWPTCDPGVAYALTLIAPAPPASRARPMASAGITLQTRYNKGVSRYVKIKKQSNPNWHLHSSILQRHEQQYDSCYSHTALAEMAAWAATVATEETAEAALAALAATLDFNLRICQR